MGKTYSVHKKASKKWLTLSPSFSIQCAAVRICLNHSHMEHWCKKANSKDTNKTLKSVSKFFFDSSCANINMFNFFIIMDASQWYKPPAILVCCLDTLLCSIYRLNPTCLLIFLAVSYLLYPWQKTILFAVVVTAGLRTMLLRSSRIGDENYSRVCG